MQKTVLVVLSLLLLTGCDDNDGRSAADLTIPVSVRSVKRADIASTLTATGTLTASRHEDIIAEVGGVLQISGKNGSRLQAGQWVEAGERLARLKNDEYALEVRVESRRMAMEDAKRELEKQSRLQKEGGVTEKELQLARRNALDTKLNYEAGLLNIAKLDLSAPIAGFVAALQASANNTMIQNGFKLCRILDYRVMLVDVKLPNSDLGKVTMGQRARIRHHSLEDDVFEGRVIAIDPTIDPNSRTFSVTVEVPNKDLTLKPGMFVKADILIEERDNAVVVPRTAVLTRGGRPVVFVVEGVSARQLDVETGIETREDFEITDGLEEGARLVIRGHETLRDKAKVRVVE